MSEAMIGYDSLFEISTDNGATWTAIAEVTDITPPSESVDVIDVTHMKSPNRKREFIAGLSDPGEASFTMNFIPGAAGDVLLRGLAGTGERVKCRDTFPNDVTWTFDGILTGYTPSQATEDKMTAEVTFKVTGSIVTGVAA